MKLSRETAVAFLLIILAGSILFGTSAKALTPVDITVDSTRLIAYNSYSVGFSLDMDSTHFLDSPSAIQLAQSANFKMVRIVDFRKNLQPCIQWYESSKTGYFNWATMDNLVQKIFAIGAEPLIVLGCYTAYHTNPVVPKGMAINPSTGLPYSASFAAYAAEWVRHFKSKGLPVRFYEIMNEAWYYFWDSWGQTNTARRSNFVFFLNTVYSRMREVNSSVLIGTDSSTLRSFLDYFVTRGAGLGFLSFHKYDSGSTYDSDSKIFGLVDKIAFESDSARYSPNKAREIWYNARGKNLPVILSETNLSWIYKSGTDPRIQKMVGAVWTALLIRACVTKGVQYSLYYRLLSSKTSERVKPTGGYGFGMINSDNDQPWYPYYVNKMIGNNLNVGDRVVSSISSSYEVSTLSWVHGNRLNILLICRANYQKAISLHGVIGQLSYVKIDNAVWWQTPRIQTGTISSSNVLVLNGYTVMILQKYIGP